MTRKTSGEVILFCVLIAFSFLSYLISTQARFNAIKRVLVRIMFNRSTKAFILLTILSIKDTILYIVEKSSTCAAQI